MAMVYDCNTDIPGQELVLSQTESNLALLQLCVGGYIQELRSPDGEASLICHEEALMMAEPVFNARASVIASGWFGCSYPIYGPVVLVENVGDKWV